MRSRFQLLGGGTLLSLAIAFSSANAQPPERDRPDGDRPARGERDGDRPARDGDRPARGERDGDRGPGARFGGPDMAPEALAKQLMERFDKDGDKKLDATELVAALQEMRPQRGRRPGDPEGQPRPGNGGPPEGANAAEMVGRIFEQNDKNGDGKLAGEEIPERMRQNIDRIDTNSDGEVDKSEAEAVFSRLRGGRPGGDRPREGGDRPREGGDRPRRPPTE